MIILLGAAEHIKVITQIQMTSGGAAVKKANNIQVARKLSTFRKKMKMTTKKINVKTKRISNNLKILGVNAANNLVISSKNAKKTQITKLIKRLTMINFDLTNLKMTKKFSLIRSY